jgi:hypothetical protein
VHVENDALVVLVTVRKTTLPEEYSDRSESPSELSNPPSAEAEASKIATSCERHPRSAAHKHRVVTVVDVDHRRDVYRT